VTVQYRYVMSWAKRLLRTAPPAYNVARRANDFVTRTILAPRRNRLQIEAWHRAGSPPPPPPPFKQRVVRGYSHRFALRVLIETGTYLGDMVEAQRRAFELVWSIELDPSLFEAAVRRFSTADNVTILKGDSGKLVPALIGGIREPCLFWLDAHYSAGITARGDLDTPIERELGAILAHPAEHVVLIDDARSFGFGDYPAIDELRRLVSERRPDWTVIVKDDIIRIHHSTRQMGRDLGGSAMGDQQQVRGRVNSRFARRRMRPGIARSQRTWSISRRLASDAFISLAFTEPLS
jgi:hypothetical protein